MLKKYKTTIWIGLLLTLLAILSGVFLEQTVLTLTLANAGIILIAIAVYTHNKYGTSVQKDERTLKLGSRAVAHSWFFTFILVNVLFWVDRTTDLLTTEAVTGITLYFMLLSAALLQYIYKKKGDI